jgi:acyl-CoA synthetase (AMP-forming)/AMP-acid ligase II
MGIAMLLESIASAMPERPLVGARAGVLTAGDLLALAGGGATVLRDAGADAVGFIGTGGPAVPVSLFATGLAGVPFTPLNYRLAAGQLAELAAGLGKQPVLIVDEQYVPAAGGVPATILTTDQWLAAARISEPGDAADVDDELPAVVLYTSGTTSKPKGAVLRHSHLVSYVLQTVEFASAAEEDAALISVPPYHIAGVGTVLTNTFAGRRIMYLPNFTAAEWLATVRDEAITQAMLVPTMLARIVDHLGGGAADVPALRSVAYGGARMPRPVLEKALSCMPGVGFTNAYGLTETSSTIAVLGPDDHRAAFAAADPALRERLGSAGRLVPGIEGQIRDELGAVLPAGEPGQLWVRGGQVSGEYLGSGSVLDERGWFHTRDQGWFDSDGYLFISGRTDDTIIRGGENIAPAEIEDVLVTHPQVKEVAVIGVPDDEWGTRIVAVIVAQPGCGLDGGTVRDYARARLRGSRTPDDVVFRTELPHTPTGKLIRRDLVRDVLGLDMNDADMNDADMNDADMNDADVSA